MLILLPFILIILIIAAINHVYYSDTKPIYTQKSQYIEKNESNHDATKKYLDRYIKR